MAALTADRTWETRPVAGTQNFTVVNAATVYIGGLVQIDATTGFVEPWDGTGTLAGMCVGYGDGVDVNKTTDGVTGNTSATPRPSVRVATGGMEIKGVAVTGAAAGDVGNQVWTASDVDNLADLTDTDTTNAAVGFLLAVRSASDCDVMLYSLKDHQLGLT